MLRQTFFVRLIHQLEVMMKGETEGDNKTYQDFAIIVLL